MGLVTKRKVNHEEYEINARPAISDAGHADGPTARR